MRKRSTTVVGYDSNTETPAIGAKVVTPFFLNVGSTSGCKLSDIKAIGYAPFTMGDAHLNVLDQFGRTIEVDDGTGTGRKIQKAYYWKDGGMVMPYITPGWYDVDSKPMKDNSSPLGNADEIQINAGDSFYVYGAQNIKLQFAGAVNQSQVSYSAKFSDAKAIGNPFAAPVKLSDINVTGYASAMFTMGAIHLNALDPYGRTIEVDDGSGTGRKIQKAYYWKDGGVIMPYIVAGWYDVDNQPLKENKSVLGNADEISIDPGVGFWVYGDTGADYMINFTCPISK